MIEEIRKSIQSLASDMGRTSQDILKDLEELRDEIQMYIEATEVDIEAQTEII